MKNWIAMVTLLTMTAGMATAAEGEKTAQQNKMSSCNKAAAGQKGDERKAFMKNCLSAQPEKQPATQQEKMKTCNAQAGAKALKGEERKAFMSSCLKA